MAATETAIANLALLRMGQELIDSIDGTDILEQKCNLLYDQARDELLINGPEDGWKFATTTYHGIDVDSTSITAFTDYSGTISGTVKVTSVSHGLESGDMVTISGTTSYNGTYDITYIDADNYYVTATYVADDATGTTQWTSEQFAYRFTVPASKSVLRVLVGGLELSDWNEVGGYILTNEESSEVDMLLVKSITDVTLFPDYFVKALYLKLAIELTYNITQDLRAIQLLSIEYEDAINKAKAMDSRKKRVKEYSSSWQDAGNVTDIIE